MAQNFTTDVTQWQGVTESGSDFDNPNAAKRAKIPTVGAVADVFGSYIYNPEYIKLLTSSNKRLIIAIKPDGDIFFGFGVPSQIEERVQEVIATFKLEDILVFLGALIDGDKTLTQLLVEKVNVEAGKGLINSTFASKISYMNSPEFATILVDSARKIIEAYKTDGTKQLFGNVELFGSFKLSESIYYFASNPEWAWAIIDKDKKIILGIDRKGKTHADFEGLNELKNYIDAQVELISERIDNLETSSIKVWAPKKIYALDGTTVQVFKNSIAAVVNPNNQELRIVDRVNVTNSNAFGYNYDYLYEYEASASNPQFGFTLALYDSLFNKEYKSTQGTTIINVAKGSSPAAMKNVLCIGDSFTDADIWVSELRRLLTGVVSEGYSDTADSDITADSLTNINFIGTRDTGANQTPNEGWSGENYKFFAGGGAMHIGDVSPFINPNTDEVDFDYYMGTGNVRGSVQTPTTTDKIDFAIILLGTNGGNEEQYVRAIWDGLLTHNPNVKVIIAGRCFACPDGEKVSIYHGHTYMSLSSSVIALNANFERLCELDTYKDNFIYVDYNVRMDILNNMPGSVGFANIRNKNDYAKIKKSQDNVHPAKEGYFQIADAFRGAFHYWFLNSNN